MKDKNPPRLINMTIYCNKCKALLGIIDPQSKVEWKVNQVVDGDTTSGEVSMETKCPECNKLLSISLSKWDTTEN